MTLTVDMPEWPKTLRLTLGGKITVTWHFYSHADVLEFKAAIAQLTPLDLAMLQSSVEAL